MPVQPNFIWTVLGVIAFIIIILLCVMCVQLCQTDQLHHLPRPQGIRCNPEDGQDMNGQVEEDPPPSYEAAVMGQSLSLDGCESKLLVVAINDV